MRSPVECGRLVDVTLAFGLATAEHGNAKQLVANASLAAFHASQKGIRWERFVDADSDETNWHLSLLGELDAAMESGQLWNAYQPKLDIRSGQIVGVERSEEHTSELQSLMRISYAVFCLKKK